VTVHGRWISLLILTLVTLGSVVLIASNLRTAPTTPVVAGVPALQAQAAGVADLRWLPAARTMARLAPGGQLSRPALAVLKRQAVERHDAVTVAQVNAILASESFVRAERVVQRWLDFRDPETGLLMNLNGSDGARVGWAYQNTAADLYPFITIGARLLVPSRYPEMVAVRDAERSRAPALPALPDDLLAPDGHAADQPTERRIFGIAEYAKDGLLPMIDRLGPDDWLPRLREIADLILIASTTQTDGGPIPGQTSEINGDVLQVLTRAYWMTGDERYREAANRIGNAYINQALPRSTWLPPYEWNFSENEPVGRRRFHMSDHGDESFSGLVEWSVLETYTGSPDAAAHRVGIRKMLDRALAKGRDENGIWLRVIDIPSGKVTQEGLTDNWGYLYQPFLTAAMLERQVPDGEPARADQYEAAVRQALRALPRYPYYPWQQGEMDGYADSIESAIYLLSRLPEPDGARWADEQIAVLFGFQHADGSVEDNYLDGNFVRTSLLYSLSLTHGVLPEPWRPDVIVGAAADGPCLEIVAGAEQPWDGQLRFDRARYREHVRLPIDYPRLNEWPTGFVLDGAASWRILDRGTTTTTALTREALTQGLTLHLDGGSVTSLRVCPA
jgi:hypothetical protein